MKEAELEGEGHEEPDCAEPESVRWGELRFGDDVICDGGDYGAEEQGSELVGCEFADSRFENLDAGGSGGEGRGAENEPPAGGFVEEGREREEDWFFLAGNSVR